LGANDFVTKTEMGKGDAAFEYLRKNLIPKIKYFCRQIPDLEPPVGSIPEQIAVAAIPQAPPVLARPILHTSPVDVIVIAASTGGPNALMEIFSQLPENLSPILIVQHMPPVFTVQFAKNLSMKSKIPVEEGQSGQKIRPGHAWIAPGDYHMVVRRVGLDGVLQIHKEEPENSCRPAADVLFRSAGKVYGRNVLAIILTGMGQDGLRGCEAISEAGGRILVQDEASSVVWGMPGYVAQAGLAHKIVPLDKMAHEIMNCVKGGMDGVSSQQQAVRVGPTN
jgi:two-component system chemotaxis response regulator CheB